MSNRFNTDNLVQLLFKERVTVLRENKEIKEREKSNLEM
jgi:hypothetical protein